MVKKVAYFSTSGETEIGGLKAFLYKINSSVEWERSFPAARKPGPKYRPGIALASPPGITGERLRQEMVDRLRARPEDFQTSEMILLIDDMDCRFNGDTVAYANWVADCQAEVQAILGRPIQFVALLASPEIEGWFLVDWRNSFGITYQKFTNHMLQTCLEYKDYVSGAKAIEEYGLPLHNNSCTKKLSNEIVQCLYQLPPDKVEGYSKKDHGAEMLGRIEPSNIAAHCRIYFADAYRILRAL